MGSKGLLLFCLLVTVLQVRAQINCYANSLCGSDGSTPDDVLTVVDCCLSDLTVTRSYAASGSSDCQPCIVIGFDPQSVEAQENVQARQEINVGLLTPNPGFSDAINVASLDIVVEVNSANSTATIGSDFLFERTTELTKTYPTQVSFLPIAVEYEILADLLPGEVESFELTITSATSEEGFEILVGNSATVVIVDDDVLEVQFLETEFSAAESDGQKEILFTIANPIIIPTHFIVRPMTYKEYDDQYDTLKADHPDLTPFTLNDEYDQAEGEDFVRGDISFTILANERAPSQPVMISLIDDDLLEPPEEGLRLLLMVDESKNTPRSVVSFGRRLALLRIDDREDSITFGFVKAEQSLDDVPGMYDVNLLLNITHGETEIPFDLFFSSEGSDADMGIDFMDFSTNLIEIQPPNTFFPGNNFLVIVLGDDVFEGDETIVVGISEAKLILPPPFISKTGQSPNSIVKAPSDNNIIVSLQRTEILIKEVLQELNVTLTVPQTINEGETFHPVLTVSQEVNATFVVYLSPGTAGTQDYSPSYFERVKFGPSLLSNMTNSPVMITTDNLVEPSETFLVNVLLTEPSSLQDLVTYINPNQMVTITDQNPATIGFKKTSLQYYEDEGEANVTVASLGDELSDTAEVEVRVYTLSGTATSGLDFTEVDMNLKLTAMEPEKNVKIPLISDTEYEAPPEKFTVNLAPISANVGFSIQPPSAMIMIIDDIPPGKDCTLSSNLNLHTFSNDASSGQNIDMSVGCERKLVTSCDLNIDLEVRVDFLQNDFSTTKVAILYNEDQVTIESDLTLNPSTSPSSEIEYDTGVGMASVKIPGIGLTVTKSNDDLTVSTDDTTLELGGLCGGLDGLLYYPECSSSINVGEPIPSTFYQSYRVKPSDLVLGKPRKVCGTTANDTVVGDPLMTVPIYAPDIGEDLNLCYEIHGAADKYFNLVSDECTTVNAHYKKAADNFDLNIIDSISVVAIDNDGVCHTISVDASSCSPVVDTTATIPPTTDPPARKRRNVNTIVDQAGVSVRSSASWVRISVPNCADNTLVMRVLCQNQHLYDYTTNTATQNPVDLIKFDITRGLNLRETSHGLLGQFWNVPIAVTAYTGALVHPENSDKYYTVEVNQGSQNARSFVGFMHDVTWEWKPTKCIYVGDRQGGPAGEVLNDGAVIQGSYQDYATSTAFGTDFTYNVFEHSDVC